MWDSMNYFFNRTPLKRKEKKENHACFAHIILLVSHKFN